MGQVFQVLEQVEQPAPALPDVVITGHPSLPARPTAEPDADSGRIATLPTPRLRRTHHELGEGWLALTAGRVWGGIDRLVDEARRAAVVPAGAAPSARTEPAVRLAAFRAEDIRSRRGGEELGVAFAGEGTDTIREAMERSLAGRLTSRRQVIHIPCACIRRNNP